MFLRFLVLLNICICFSVLIQNTCAVVFSLDCIMLYYQKYALVHQEVSCVEQFFAILSRYLWKVLVHFREFQACRSSKYTKRMEALITCHLHILGNSSHANSFCKYDLFCHGHFEPFSLYSHLLLLLLLHHVAYQTLFCCLMQFQSVGFTRVSF